MNNRTWAEISLDNICHNLNLIKSKTSAKIMAIVKADAYGHGAREICSELEIQGVGCFGVSSLDEALELRDSGINTPVLVLGYTDPEMTGTLIERDIWQTVYSPDFAQAFSQKAQSLGLRLTVHIKVDTGMSRLGFAEDGRLSAANAIIETAKLPGLACDGIFTHLAKSDDLSSGFSHSQLSKFKNLLDYLNKNYVNFSIRHCANSGGVLNYPETHLDMVRPGLILYGISDDPDLDLRPSLSLKSRLSQVRRINKGDFVGYSCTFQAPCDMTVGVVPAGYADGYPWSLANTGYAGVNGVAAPLIGRVCMDMLMLDLSKVPDARAGDEVCLFGSANPGPDAQELAKLAGTIPYEILCRISRRVPRVYFAFGEHQKSVNYLHSGSSGESGASFDPA